MIVNSDSIVFNFNILTVLLLCLSEITVKICKCKREGGGDGFLESDEIIVFQK